MMNFKETLNFLPMVQKTNLVPLLLGHTGIGKTELVEQYAKSIGYTLIIIHVAQLEPSDFVGLYKTTADNRTTNCPPTWLPYIKEMEGVEVTETENSKGYIVFLDEVNRGHEDIRQAMYQFLTTKCIHTYKAPPNTFIIAAANPASKYECYEFDAALVNRFANIKFRPEVNECLGYLEEKYGDNLILTWLGTDKGLIELGDDDFEVTDLKLTPRITENAIKLFTELENCPITFQRKALETIMPKEKVASFLSFVDEIKHINAIDVLNGVKGQKIKDLLKKNRIDILSTITADLGKTFASYELGVTKLKSEIEGLKVSDKEVFENLGDFLKEAPADIVTLFIDLLGDSYQRKTCILNEPSIFSKLKTKLIGFQKVLSASKSTK